MLAVSLTFALSIASYPELVIGSCDHLIIESFPMIT